MVRVLSVVLMLAVPSVALADDAPPPPPQDAPTQAPPLVPADTTPPPDAAKTRWCGAHGCCGSGGKVKAIVVTTVAATVITTIAVAVAVGVANAQPARTLVVR